MRASGVGNGGYTIVFTKSQAIQDKCSEEWKRGGGNISVKEWESNEERGGGGDDMKKGVVDVVVGKLKVGLYTYGRRDSKGVGCSHGVGAVHVKG